MTASGLEIDAPLWAQRKRRDEMMAELLEFGGIEESDLEPIIQMDDNASELVDWLMTEWRPNVRSSEWFRMCDLRERFCKVCCEVAHAEAKEMGLPFHPRIWVINEIIDLLEDDDDLE